MAAKLLFLKGPLPNKKKKGKKKDSMQLTRQKLFFDRVTFKLIVFMFYNFRQSNVICS